MRDVSPMCIAPTHTLRQAVSRLNQIASVGILLIVDEQRRLIDTLTDGDLRRAMMSGLSFDEPVSVLISRREDKAFPAAPVVARLGASRHDLLALFGKAGIRHVPLLDAEGRVADLALATDFLPALEDEVSAVVMAGGRGSRLAPLTDAMPKPMLPVGEKPMMQHLVEQLRESGIRRLNVTVHYKPEAITEYFGNGDKFGVSIGYVREDLPLGTGGALGLINTPDTTFLVINGDILTQVSIRSMLAFHREMNATMTIGLSHYELNVPWGVVETDGPRIRDMKEKPRVQMFVNAGIYMLEPKVYGHIVPGERFDMPELAKRLIAAGEPVIGFPISEYWLDIGHPADYQRACDDVAKSDA